MNETPVMAFVALYFFVGILMARCAYLWDRHVDVTSLVVIAATLTQFGLPVEGIALILGVDTFLDMGRTATNVLGNAVATAVITKWEGMLQPMRDPDAPFVAEAPHDTVEHGRHGLNLDPTPDD